MAQHQLPRGRVERDSGFDVGLFAHRQHHRAHQPRHARRVGHRHGHDHRQQAGPPRGHQHDREQDAGDRHHAVHHAHDRAIQPAEIARYQPHGQPERHRRQRHAHAHRQRHARAVQRAAPDIAAQAVGAEREQALEGIAGQRHDLGAGARCELRAGRVHGVGIDGVEPGRGHGKKQHQQQDGAAGAHGAVAQHRAQPRGAAGSGGGGGLDGGGQ
ncbi:hypothetical protein D9M70_311310 [compost metagenome]